MPWPMNLFPCSGTLEKYLLGTLRGGNALFSRLVPLLRPWARLLRADSRKSEIWPRL